MQDTECIPAPLGIHHIDLIDSMAKAIAKLAAAVGPDDGVLPGHAKTCTGFWLAYALHHKRAFDKLPCRMIVGGNCRLRGPQAWSCATSSRRTVPARLALATC